MSDLDDDDLDGAELDNDDHDATAFAANPVGGAAGTQGTAGAAAGLALQGLAQQGIPDGPAGDEDDAPPKRPDVPAPMEWFAARAANP